MDSRTLFARFLIEDCEADGIHASQLCEPDEDGAGAEFALRSHERGHEHARAIQNPSGRFDLLTYDHFWGRWFPHMRGLLPSEVADVARDLIEGGAS